MAKNNENKPYVVMATAFGHPDQQISSPMPKDNADALADKLKVSMDAIDSDYKVFDKIKVKAYTPVDLYPDKQKNDPYDYSVLDDIDKKIESDKEWKIKDSQGKVEK